MPYLNLDLDYWTNRKTVRLVGLLGAGAELLPLRLWTYVAKHHPETGHLKGYLAEELESAAGWTGIKGKMVDAMLTVGLLENLGDGFKIHGWLDHAGHLAAFKKRAKTAAKKRWRSYATSTPKPKITNAPILPILSVPTKPIKEKKESLPPSPEAIEIAQLLSDKIFENFPNRTAPTEATLTAWAHDAGRIHVIDGHSWEDIRSLLEWSQCDDFWKQNILSLSKFRKQWNQLIARRESGLTSRGGSKIHELRSRSAMMLKRGIKE